MLSSVPCVVKAFKYGEVPHYEWKSNMVYLDNDFVLVISPRGRKLKHFSRGTTLSIEHASIEAFFLHNWYTISANLTDNRITSYYCNIALPSVLTVPEYWRPNDTAVVSFVDLDLDLVKRPNKSWEVVDEDEFLVNQVKYNYPADIVGMALQELSALQTNIHNEIAILEGLFYSKILGGIFHGYKSY